MTSNAEATETFRTIADLLDLLGEKFKPEAYRRAARSIESLTEDLGAVAARRELRAIPGVGEAIAEKIEEYLRTGSVSYYERLKREVPPGLVELMRLPGLGPKTARRFWVELGVEGPNELRDAIAAGRLVGVKGFGEKKIEQIRSALAAAAAGPGAARRAIEEVYPVAHSIVRALREGAGADRVEVAGSFRRARETVGDLDILVTSKDPGKVFETFTAQPLVAEVKMRGETKETVVLSGGLQVDLRVVKPEEFGAALQYFTGSKDHNVRLRSLAREQGLKINEYGVFRGDERIGGQTEEEVYATLGLPWIPPELREDRGEIDAARLGSLPRLVDSPDLRGDLHVHLPDEPSLRDLEQLRADAGARKLVYAAVVVGGVRSDGSTWRAPAPIVAAVTGLRDTTFRAIPAIEVGPGAVPDEIQRLGCEHLILRPTGPPPARFETPARSPASRLVAHVGGTPETIRPWLDLARAAGAALEVGPGSERADSTVARSARESGIPLAIPTGLTEPDGSATREVAVGFARRAGARKEDVTNAGNAEAPTPASKRTRR